MKNATTLPSCTVSIPRRCNYATHPSKDATDSATTYATRDIKSLANKVLQRNQPRNSNATQLLHHPFSDATHSLPAIVHGLEIDTVKNLAADDWDWINKNLVILEAFAKAWAELEERKQGKIPKHYTAKTHCKHCGEAPSPLN